MGRFISADALVSTGQGILGNNMFAYCGNNSVCRSDYSGLAWSAFFDVIKNTIRNLIHSGAHALSDWGIDTAGIGASILDMYESSPGVFHAKTNCWQRFFGYNSIYDFVFDLGTSMSTNQFAFSHNGTDYVIWVWKGDYVNLGAGAEAGIYYGGGPHWLVNTELSMPMTISLDYLGKNIISHAQTTWWITGFNSNYINVSASDLTASFSFSFTDPSMFYSMYQVWNGHSGWVFDPTCYSSTYSF